MTDGSFPPPPGFQPPPAPGGYVGAPPNGGPGLPPGGYPPPSAPKSRTGCWIGCGGGCLVLLVLLALGILFIKPLLAMMIGWIGIAGLSALTSGAVVWNATSPDGARVAELRRAGLGSAQLAYSLTVTPVGGGDRCTAAFLFGDRAENYVHVEWVGPTALTVRYGTPTSASAFQAPTVTSGSNACTGITVTPMHDPSLDALAEAMNNGSNSDALPVDGGAGGKPGADDAPAPDSGDQPGGGK